MTKPLRAGDVIRLVNPRYGEPTGDCTMIADQDGVLVWFQSSESTSPYRGPCFVARWTEVKVMRRRNLTEEARS